VLGSVSIGYTAESSRLESGAWWWHCAYPLTLKHGPPLTMGGAGTPAYVAVKGETSLAREPSALQVSVRVFWRCWTWDEADVLVLPFPNQSLALT
jgi:hypothetical protein